MLNEKALIYAEVNNGQVHSVFYELLTKTKTLTQGEVACVVLGTNLDAAISELTEAGVDKVYVLDNAKLEIYNPDLYAAAIEKVVSLYKPEIFFFGATSIGEELAPTMGLKLNTGVAAHCMDVRLNEDGSLAQLVPAFGGKVVGEIFTPNTTPKIISAKPGIFSSEKFESKNYVVEAIDASVIDIKTAITPLEVQCNTQVGVDIEKADFVACAGYGLPNKADWDNLETLSGMLSGATGYTRPVIEFGFVDGETNMIGTSGKSIKPKVYLGVGISGSTHHVCGMQNSGVIIAVNQDPKAEIFNSCDYKVVGDADRIITALVEELR